MNKILYILSFVCLAAVLVMSSCSDDDSSQPSPTAEQKVALMNDGTAWVVESVIKDDFDVTSQYTDFRLVLGDFTYAVENSVGNAWPKAEGTWTFANDEGTVIVREDGVNMNVMLTDTTLQLTFTANSKSGRVHSVEGEYVFNLKSE
ncbi:hypothetical protein E1176_04825 [Fulvivirga sp. RKSG066]|uniref:hypothetical protein n=1 Tax=Fulvivirga aurantia TaxID=2529383 RepID=UPI0012BBB35E|nr:hypothetical protein [Fulvivirga aurantia]MTI20338.1 hypothetical protein [Fulvivirga aurantia]